MSKPKKTKPASARTNRTHGQQGSNSGTEGLSRRTFLGVGSAGLAGAALVSLAVNAQDKTSTQKAEHDHSSSNPRQENRGLLALNPNSNTPRRPTTAMLYPSGTRSIWQRSVSKRAAGHTRSRNGNCRP